jgi:hypothetical protein
MYRFLVLFLAAATGGGGSTGTPNSNALAELCVSTSAHGFRTSGANCRSVPDSATFVAITDDRLFVWTSPDRLHVRFGRTGAGQARLRNSEDDFDVLLRLQSDSSVWPADTSLKIDRDSSPADRWEWTIPRAAVKTFGKITLPSGAYTLTIAAAHHQPLEVRISSKRKASRALGTLRLKALPVIHGHVIDRSTRQPLAGVLVQLASGKSLAITDGNGEFRGSLASTDTAEGITLMLGGYGSRTIPLSKTTADMDLGIVELSTGGELHVVLRNAKRYTSIRVRVARKEAQKQSLVAVNELASGNAECVVKNLESGEYVVTVSGEKPLQQMATIAKVKGGETAETEMEIQPIDLSGLVSRRDRPIAGANLAIKALITGWTANVITDDQGEFREELWEGGQFAVKVTTSELRAPYFFMDEIQDIGGFARWNIRVPGGSITGGVVDAASRRPIPGAAVTLDSELSGNDTTRSIGAESNDQGVFVFDAVEAGRHVVTAEAERYTPARSPAIVFATNDESRHVELALSRAKTVQVLVMSAESRPIAGAAVVHELLPPDVVPRTDSDGRVDVPISGDARPVLLVLPLEGSFAVASPTVSPSNDLLAIPVPLPTTGLAISVFDETSGAPVGRVNILIRYNGIFLPPRLMALAAQSLGTTLKTDSNGSLILTALPAGRYELWPYGGVQEAGAIMQGGIAPPVVVLASSGLQTVRITLRTK